jgi:asparagine synthase (glutamine-hydrolysing)
MCGICGVVNLENHPVKEQVLHPMMQAMKHRGPDDQGTFSDNNVALGFVRLSIIDLSTAGHQPMFSDDGRYVLIFNGEIFNYIEIKEELISMGHSFTTKTDSEVLLKAYIQWGEDCLNRFNGMWAFVIYDLKSKTFFASRDRFGIKPFYYYFDNKQFIFASEIPSILAVLDNKPKPNDQVIYDYLAFNRTDQTEDTFFKNIKKLQHGHKLLIQGNNFEIKKWYNLKTSLKTPFSSPEEYREMLKSSINLRLRSDVPVGVCFSGGLDSSAIVSLLLSGFGKTDLNTFSSVYTPGQTGDESKFINLYKPDLNNMFFITPDAETLFSDLKRFTCSQAEPTSTTSPYAQFKVMQLAKGKVVVTLDGQGADEQLAGYHYFFGLYFKELFVQAKIGKLTIELIKYLKIHKSLYGLKTMLFFLLPGFLRTKLRESEKAFLAPDFAKKFRGSNTISNNLYAANNLQEALLNHFEYKLEHLLKWEDRNSMFHSIEARTPFLDYRLVEKTLSLASDQFINKGTTKIILRDAMKGVIPEKIRQRQDKTGFSTPADQWFREDGFKDYIFQRLNDPVNPIYKYLDKSIVLQKFNQHQKGKINISKDIWKWINLDFWFQEYIN